MTRVRNIDDLIHGIPEAQPINVETSPVNVEKSENPPQKDEKQGSQEPEIVENVSKSPVKEEKPSDKPLESGELAVKQQEGDVPLDEYGNTVAKPKMYTEEQVQAMIRDRLSRGRYKNEQQEQQVQSPQPTAQQIQQAQSQGFQYDEDSDVAWEQQLEHFVERTLHKVSARQQQEQQKARDEQNKAYEEQVKAEFESKFFTGMARYPDFIDTLKGKPVTDNMMNGIRGIENPAAFLYAAAKKMPDELSRISEINDPYIQVAEMGKLHERLTKTKSSSNAPRPVHHDRSDVSDKTPARFSIDHLIAEDAAKRYRR